MRGVDVRLWQTLIVVNSPPHAGVRLGLSPGLKCLEVGSRLEPWAIALRPKQHWNRKKQTLVAGVDSLMACVSHVELFFDYITSDFDGIGRVVNAG